MLFFAVAGKVYQGNSRPPYSPHLIVVCNRWLFLVFLCVLSMAGGVMDNPSFGPQGDKLKQMIQISWVQSGSIILGGWNGWMSHGVMELFSEGMVENWDE